MKSGSGRNITFPHTENFNTQSQYYNDLIWIDDTVMTFTHEATGGWQGSGAPKFTFVNSAGEQSSGIGIINFPISGGAGPRRVNVRWLVYYGPTYESIGMTETKSLILARCNGNCTAHDVSGQRGMVLESHSPPFVNAPYICENIEAGGTEPQEPGKPLFVTADRLGQWISFEAEYDLNNSIAKLYIDTQDGVQNSEGGTRPYKVWTAWDTSNSWWGISWLMGYWEARSGVNANSYFKIDELAIDTRYIGPPSGFRTVGSPPPPVRIPTPPSSLQVGQ
ncbi:MAG: hypothetical protein C4529_08800 [Deltaproteobacteria bacterium]|nr:MAG: hypothetical protein C4529_08800 [Deltaproteobacteria bacterium]